MQKTTGAATFEMDGIGYETDAETLEVLRVAVPRAKESGDSSAVAAVMALGLKAGRIRVAALKCPACYRPLPVYEQGSGFGYFQNGDDVCETCQEPIRRAGNDVVRVASAPKETARGSEPTESWDPCRG